MVEDVGGATRRQSKKLDGWRPDDSKICRKISNRTRSSVTFDFVFVLSTELRSLLAHAGRLAMERVSTVVIGAGVVGLAVARRFPNALILDRASRIGAETSSRNSEVVHAGLYYPPGSLKGKLCMRGKQLLYEYCRERSIFCHRIGKLIVATDEAQLRETLPKLKQQAVANGVMDTRVLSKEEVRDLEPELETVGALHSPSTGIVDSHSFMYALLADVESQGGTLALNTKVTDARIRNGRVELFADGVWLSCDRVINCAGLWADHVARLIHHGSEWDPPRQYYARGTYFRLQGVTSPFKHLIYPVPDVRGGLGVHATLDQSGQVKFGPDVEWLPPEADIDTISWEPDLRRGDVFYEAIRRYWPSLPNDALAPDYTGVRPKLAHPDLGGTGFRNFCFLAEKDHGIPGLVHLMGIESPGLTSSLAIADHVAQLVDT